MISYLIKPAFYLLCSKNQTIVDVSEDLNLAEFLYSEVRVLCVVMTSDQALNDYGLIIMDTWGKRCNKLLFFSEKASELSLRCCQIVNKSFNICFSVRPKI